MFFRRKKKEGNVEPDLPITPMLDMSFQLMAFFIITFRPTKTEAQLPLALPKEEGGPSQVAPLNPDPTQEDELILQVYARDETGEIDTVVAALKTGNEDISRGSDTGKVFDFLKQRAAMSASGKPPKLKIEMADRLNYQFVIKLLDEGRRAGFESISPAPLTPPKN